MKLFMLGIDFHTAALEIREKFSVTAKKMGVVARRIKENAPNINGCVLLSTCNRTEIYISASCDMHIKKILLDVMEVPYDAYADYFTVKQDKDVIRHLMEVACGLQSLVLGEDQIIAQVKAALAYAHEEEACDGILQTVFRTAITAAKKVKTNVKLSNRDMSVPYQAVDVLKKEIKSLADCKALVIGNGEMGKRAAALLAQQCQETAVTIREYKKGTVFVPEGCNAIPYSERYAYIETCDLVVSATTSPHYTITKEELQKLNKVPRYFVDLSVPRDVEPSVAALGATVLNIDDLGTSHVDTAALDMAADILAQYEKKFYDWYAYRENLRLSI